MTLADTEFAGVDFRKWWENFCLVRSPKGDSPEPMATRQDLKNIQARLLARDPWTMLRLEAAITIYLRDSERLTPGQIFACLMDWEESEELRELCWTHLAEVLERLTR